MTKLAKNFTFRDPIVTIDYPAGFDGPMPEAHEQAARDAGAIEETVDGHDSKPDEAGPSRRTRRAKG
jgi:hypothetical protein